LGCQLDLTGDKQLSSKWTKFVAKHPEAKPDEVLVALLLKKANRTNSEIVDRFFVLTSAALIVSTHLLWHFPRVSSYYTLTA
jgi:hypothetical protein